MSYRPPRRWRGRSPSERVQQKRGQMNKTERAYAEHLQNLLEKGVIAAYAYESWTFKLADDTRLTPDFAIWFPDGSIELHEVKGRTSGGKPYFEEDAKVKVKVLGGNGWIPLIVVWPDRNGGWCRKEFT